MAYINAYGGGGIPAALKTRMNAVLNKKFGTVKTYEPNKWPDDVNLLGMLEEKTASSASVCSFSDGADDVPMKSVVAHIAPTLTGTSAVNMVQSGKNLLENQETSRTESDVTFTKNSDGSVSLSGTASADINYTIYSNFEFPKLGQYVISGCPLGGSTSTYRIFATNYGSDTGRGLSVNVTNVSTKTSIRINIKSGTNTNGLMFKPMVEVGSSASSYESYTAPTTYTANLGRTVYGADVDLVSGHGSETYGYIVFDGSDDESWYAYANYEGYSINIATMKVGNRQDGVCNQLTNSSSSAQGQSNVFWLGVNTSRFYVIGVYQSMGSTLEAFKAYLAENPLILVYPLATETDFTFGGQEIPSLLGVNNLWHEAGDTEAVYRSSGTVTPVPVVPTLISKTITQNGTYSAEDDDADGYSEVIVNVQGGGEEPFVPQFTETKIADNSAHASSFTLTEDYGNYDMVKIVWYESATSSGFLYTTPDILDEIFSVGAGKLCINKPSTNYYVCYTKSGLTWTQTNQRNIYVHEVYGVTFTNCTMTATDLYKRGASTTTKYAVTSQTSLKDYDLFMMASIHNTDGSETMPTTWLYQYPPENMSEAFSCPVPAVLQEYNANDEAFVISEYGMTSARYFMVQGVKFTAVSSSRGLMMESRPVTQLVGEESDPDQVNELVEDDENDIPEQLNEVVENDETEQEGEDDA